MPVTQTENPISIHFTGVSKKFGTNWIFRQVNAIFESGKKYAITGANGSGKSTLLKIAAGMVTPNQGQVTFKSQHKEIPVEEIFSMLSFCAPYQDLPEELTLAELLQFHGSLRQLTATAESIIKELEIDPAKEIRNYSSGMKQRLKLALAFYTRSQVLFLDEPTNTLDERWSRWYLQKVNSTPDTQLVIICSNHPPEYNFCTNVLDITNYIK